MVRLIAVVLTALMLVTITPFTLLSTSGVYAADDGPRRHGAEHPDPRAAFQPGWYYAHPTNCFMGILGSSVVLFVFAQEGTTWFTNIVSEQIAITPACQTGNLLAFHVVDASGNWDGVYTHLVK